MTDFFNYALSILFLAFIIYETYLILTRNRKIEVKGKDDFFATILILVFVLLIFPFNLSNTLIVSLRNTLAILSVFASFAVRRGLMPKGVAKFGFIIPWSKIETIYLEPGQYMHFSAIFKTKKYRMKLSFHVVSLQDVFNYLTSYSSNIMVEKSLDLKLKK